MIRPSDISTVCSSRVRNGGFSKTFWRDNVLHGFSDAISSTVCSTAAVGQGGHETDQKRSKPTISSGAASRSPESSNSRARSYGVNVISFIIAPGNAQQIAPAHQPQPRAFRLDPLDERIIGTVADSGPIHVWRLLNQLTEDDEPTNRAAGRAARQSLWQRVKRLIHEKRLFYSGRNSVALTKTDRTNWPSSPPRVRRKAANQRARWGAQDGTPRERGSGPSSPARVAPLCERQQVGDELEVADSSNAGRPTTAKCAEPPNGEATASPKLGAPRSASQQVRDELEVAGRATGDAMERRNRDGISRAASALASLPRRQPRRWTGWLSTSVRGYRDQRVTLPDGRVWFLYGAIRGKAIVTPDRGRLMGGFDEPFRWAVMPANQVVPVKNEAARLLGSMKRGRKERPSLRKQEAARRNGRLSSHRHKAPITLL
jgi:hypothetical protein